MKKTNRRKKCEPVDISDEWRVHTSRLLTEILCNSHMAALVRPLQIFSKLLCDVGERAIELDDPKLNALMCRLTIYSAADPESPEYDPELVRRVSSKGKRTAI